MIRGLENKGLGPDGKAGVLHTSIEKVRFLQDPPTGVIMEALPTKKEFYFILFVIVVGFGLITGCDSDPAYFKFKVGQMIQTKLDGTKGQILQQWSHRKQYTVRFAKDAKFESRTMHEFELEKYSGERR